MTPEMPTESSAPRGDGALSRRDLLLRTAAGGAGLAAVPLLGTTPGFRPGAQRQLPPTPGSS